MAHESRTGIFNRWAETRLLEQVVVALITGLDAAGGVHGPRAGRPRVVHETRVEGLAVHLRRREAVVSQDGSVRALH